VAAHSLTCWLILFNREEGAKVETLKAGLFTE